MRAYDVKWVFHGVSQHIAAGINLPSGFRVITGFQGQLTIYSIIHIYASMNLNVDEMLPAADEASELLKSLANRHRLLILCQLIENERSVGELASFLGIRASAVSQHLALLRKDGLVMARRQGHTIYSSISSGPARELLRTLYRVYCSPAKTCRIAGSNERQ